MRLPRNIELEIQHIEREYNSRGGQHAGTFHLRGLRDVIEAALRGTPDLSPLRDAVVRQERFEQWAREAGEDYVWDYYDIGQAARALVGEKK